MKLVTNLIDTANQFIIEQLGEFGPLFVAAGLGILMIAIALPLVLFRKKDPMEKLLEQQKTTQASSGKDGGLRVGGKDQRLDRFAQYLEPTNQIELSDIRLKLIRAGYRSKGAVQTFHFAQLALGLGMLGLGTIYILISPGQTPQATAMSVLLPGMIGYMAPKYWVTKRVQQREEEIITGFPDSLDLMLVCVEAGQSLDQAIIRVAKEMRTSYPALSEEFEIIAYEMKAGKDKTQVLRDMAERVGVQDVNSFVTTLIQATTYGTSIADALRVYGSEMRDKRVMRAEEKANKLPVKLTLGTMFFCVPPLLVILIGPSVYGITQNFGG